MNWKSLEGCGCGLILRDYSGLHVEGMRKTTKNLSHDSRSLGQDLNSGPPDYMSNYLHSLSLYFKLSSILLLFIYVDLYYFFVMIN